MEDQDVFCPSVTLSFMDASVTQTVKNVQC